MRRLLLIGLLCVSASSFASYTCKDFLTSAREQYSLGDKQKLTTNEKLVNGSLLCAGTTTGMNAYNMRMYHYVQLIGNPNNGQYQVQELQ